MKKKIYTQFIFVVAIFFMVNNTFANTEKVNNKDFLTIYSIFSCTAESNMQDDLLTIRKTTKNGLDVYTFVPEKIIDKETLLAIENRLKVMIEGFVSVSANDKNVIKIVTDPTKITAEGLERSINIVIRFYEFNNGNYQIEE